jgi:uncharacterized glyoxalase superfamily protein PhnB
MTPRLNAIGIVTDDLPRSLAFYRRLGVAVDDPAEGRPHVEARLADGMKLMWDDVDTIRSFRPDWQPPAGDARVSFAVELDTPDEVDALYTELTSAGGTGGVAPWDAVWGQRYAVLEDPDGNEVDLYAAAEPPG